MTKFSDLARADLQRNRWSGKPQSRAKADFEAGQLAAEAGQAPRRGASRAWLEGYASEPSGSISSLERRGRFRVAEEDL